MKLEKNLNLLNKYIFATVGAGCMQVSGTLHILLYPILKNLVIGKGALCLKICSDLTISNF